MATRKPKTPPIAPNITAQRSAEIFGAPDSIFTGRTKVSSKGLQRGLREMVARVWGNVPSVAPTAKTRGMQSKLALTYIGETAQCKYDWNLYGATLAATAVINLPVIGADDNMIPRSIADQYTAYALHELGHVLFTPLNKFRQAIYDLTQKYSVDEGFAKAVVNSLEDVDIERNIIAHGYAPGAATMLASLLSKCVNDVPRSAYGSMEAFSCTLAFGLRGYAPNAVPMVEALPPTLRAIYNDAAKDMAALPRRKVGDYEAMTGVVAVAEKVIAALCALRDKSKQPEQKPDEPAPADGQGDEPAPADGRDVLAEVLNGSIKALSSDLNPEAAGDIADGATGIGNDNVVTRNAAECDQAAAEKITRIATATLGKAPKVSQALRQILDASAYDTKEGGRRSGSLRTGALHRVATGADTVFERRSYRDGSDSAVTLLIDESFSMNSGGDGSWRHATAPIHHARNLAAALARLLSQSAGATFECLGFTTSGGSSSSDLYNMTHEIMSNDGTAEDRNEFSAISDRCRINIYKAFKDAPATAMRRLNSCNGSGGTPDAAAIVTACDRLLLQPAERRIFIMLADGDGSPKEVLSKILQRYEARGIIAIGIGICQDMNEAFTYRARVDDTAQLGSSGLATLLSAVAKDHAYHGGGDD